MSKREEVSEAAWSNSVTCREMDSFYFYVCHYVVCHITVLSSLCDTAAVY